MTTAAVIIEDALSDILVRASESPIPADEMQSAIRVMNRMTAAWNLDIDYTDVENPSDVLTLIQGAELAIQKNLAVLLAPQFDAAAGIELKAQANRALKDLKKIVVKVGKANYPSTLAVGSGNTRFYDTTTFYPDIQQEFDTGALLDFNTNATETTISTAGTAVLVAGAWINRHSARMTATSDGRITFNPTISETLAVSANATVLMASSGDKQVIFQIALNGVLVADTLLGITASNTISRTISIPWVGNFSTGDYIEFFVINNDDTVNILITDATLRVG